MAILFKSSDRVKLTMGEITLTLSPLTYGQKINGATLPTSQSGGKQRVNMALLAHLMVKYSVKGIKGVDNADGSEYKLAFEEIEFDGVSKKKKESVLTDECADELIEGLLIKPSLSTIAYQLINGIPDYITDSDGEKAKGVKLEIVGKRKTAKRKTK